MGSTIDFASFDDDDLLFGFKRVNRFRFPENFSACTEEIQRRGLSFPEKFEIPALDADSALSIFQRLGEGFSAVASTFGGKISTPQA